MNAAFRSHYRVFVRCVAGRRLPRDSFSRYSHADLDGTVLDIDYAVLVNVA